MTFCFSVASRSVGFHIYNIGKFSDKDFEFSINLWGEGGPNWKFEEAKFYKEQDEEWTQVKSKKSLRTSVFKRLSFPASNSNKSPVPVATVFDRINSSIVKSATNTAINRPISNNGHSFGRAKSLDKINSEFIWVSKRSQRDQSEAKLPGILLFMKFPSFPKVDWPDDSYLNWFKARGPPAQIKQVSCLKDLGPTFFGAKITSASSSSFNTVQTTESIACPSAILSSSAATASPMANFPIDPRQFVPRGFQILQVPGRTAVKRVVVARRPRAHEEFGIASITPFPPGQVPFANVAEILQEFLVHNQVGFRDIQECPLGAAYVRFNHVRDRDRLIRASPIPFGDVHVSFCKHNEGVNWRHFSFNREC
jgi:hypothetical protein